MVLRADWHRGILIDRFVKFETGANWPQQVTRNVGAQTYYMSVRWVYVAQTN